MKPIKTTKRTLTEAVASPVVARAKPAADGPCKTPATDGQGAGGTFRDCVGLEVVIQELQRALNRLPVQWLA